MCLIKYVGPKCTSFKILDQVGVPTLHQNFTANLSLVLEGYQHETRGYWQFKKVISDKQSLEQWWYKQIPW